MLVLALLVAAQQSCGTLSCPRFVPEADVELAAN